MSVTLSDHELLQTALAWRREGLGVAIATVAQTFGSAPRGPGSHLIIDQEGFFLGSVSGGCVEGEVILQALATIETGAAQLLEFGVEDERAWRVGLPCGGVVKIYVERVD